jgi:hypothetical protein
MTEARTNHTEDTGDVGPAATTQATASSKPPFLIVGSEDAGYCADGVCVLPSERDTPPAPPRS